MNSNGSNRRRHQIGILALAMAAFYGGARGAEEPSVADLCRTLQSSDDPGERSLAATTLGKIRSQEAIIPLIYALDDPSQYVSGAAAYALGKIGDPSAIDPVLAAWDRIETLYPPHKDPARWHRKCIVGFRAALAVLTGQNFGFDLGAWKKWRAEDAMKQNDKDK